MRKRNKERRDPRSVQGPGQELKQVTLTSQYNVGGCYRLPDDGLRRAETLSATQPQGDDQMTNLTDRINALATVANAEAYAATSEKFSFCIDLLEISANRADADHWVNELEDKFDLINSIVF